MDLPKKNRIKKSPLGAPDSLSWFFEDDKSEVQGPMSFRDLRTKAIEGKISAGRKVWREGDDERYPAEDIVGLLPHSSAPSEAEQKGPESSLDNENPYATPNAERTIMDGPPGGLYLPYLREVHFSILLVCLLAGAGLIYGASLIKDTQIQIITFTFAGIALALWLIFSLIYLKRAWDMMSILGAPISGTKAVSILLLPFFNAVWAFIAIFGWARLWNHQVKRHPGLSMAHSVWRPIFLLFCIGLMMCEVITLMLFLSEEFPDDLMNPSHQFALVTFTVTLLLSLALWFQLCRSVNFLARKKS
ncbi:DUF4339 domain-containing protein [Akkermansiaceae bacterium]|nr:DUF4339 domain-containing protein [Akkermansiaceae bacterium]MDA7936264.1 DUF4339 domain-containing protein [bacterium]MDA7519233.1 DUF4339 domain-containing protein [Akkermansiaceae bacterium]MDA7675284.1 DUF4339 domain-containing protein [Akkermansiaceae bacterium]MDA7862576.1 DUF4339 domain-containing protein [Akkermansiaceae bacterium]